MASKVTKKTQYNEMSERDEILIYIDGGVENGGQMICVEVPIGHSADGCDVKITSGDGWEEIDKDMDERMLY